jgi:hypothetical protein
MHPTSKPLGLVTLALAAALCAPAAARELRLTTTMARNFIGGAYIVIYLVDAEGRYKSTLQMRGTTPRYYSQLRHWYRATDVAGADRAAEADGKTAASVRRGDIMELSVDLADELFDAGNVVRIDSTLYEGRDYATDVAVPLESGAAGVVFDGRGYVKSLKIDL